MASMVVSAWVEHRRLTLFHQGRFHRSSESGLHRIDIVDMSVFCQIPQYLLVGLSVVPPPPLPFCCSFCTQLSFRLYAPNMLLCGGVGPSEPVLASRIHCSDPQSR